MLQNDQALSVTEVARRLGVNRKTVYNLIKRHEIPAIRVSRLWRVPQSALEAFIGTEALVRESASPWPGTAMLKMAGMFASGLPDVAERHDYYLYESDNKKIPR